MSAVGIVFAIAFSNVAVGMIVLPRLQGHYCHDLYIG